MWSEISEQHRLLHIVDNGELHPGAFEKFLSDFRQVSARGDKLERNYADAEFDIGHHTMFDALYDRNGQFVACSGIYRRNPWPAGAYRVLNRTYYSPAFRNPAHFQFFGSDHILPYQMKACRTPLDFVFVSRQGPFAGKSLHQINLRPVFGERFTISEVFVQVVPQVYDRFSFQKILYRKMRPEMTYTFPAVRDLGRLSADAVRTVHF